MKDKLKDWTDWDGAAFEIGVMLGLFEPGSWLENKHVFWTNCPLGTVLHNMLEGFAKYGILEKRDEPDNQYRYREDFGK